MRVLLIEDDRTIAQSIELMLNSESFKQGQAECAEFVVDRRVEVERLFTHRWKLEQAEEAYRLFDTQTAGKAVILPS